LIFSPVYAYGRLALHGFRKLIFPCPQSYPQNLWSHLTVSATANNRGPGAHFVGGLD